MTYIVIKRLECPECERGIIQHPDWSEYWKRFPPGLGDEEKEAEFWASMGYGYRDIIPPEEVNCPECDGRGVIETEVNLVDVLEELGIAPSFDGIAPPYLPKYGRPKQ